jgi:hypothetical protein
MKNVWRADPLVWGHGPRIFEMFLEPTCPFSVTAFGKLDGCSPKRARTTSPSSSAFSRSLGTCTRV